MSSFALKILALASMTADHLGYKLFPHALALRVAGRLSFPLFAFLIAQGFKHTGDVRKYALRLAVSAVVSEVPFDLFISGRVSDLGAQNVMFTLLIGLMSIMLYDWFQTRRMAQLGLLSVLAFCMLAQAISADYGFAGVLMIFVCYVCRHRRVFVPWFIVAAGCTSVLAYAASGPRWALIQLSSLLALPFMLFYNGKKGRSLKLFFYAFYPLHLLAIYAVSLYAAG